MSIHVESRTLFSMRGFPQKRYAPARGAEVRLGIGGNQKSSLACFWHALRALSRNPRIHIVATSPIYHNPPFGFLQQPWFDNATITLRTCLSLRALFALTSYLERRFGRARKRAFPNAPRTLDIDILFFGALFVNTPSLRIPHRQWANRESVLVPLLFEKS